MSTKSLSFADLQTLVIGDGAAIRVHQKLQPAGGPGDKVFPPTYATGDNTLKYAVETRRIQNQDVKTALLDSVASQANRMEEALLNAWERGSLDFPVIGVRFDDPELADLGTVTSLQAPHRIADAILRDATSPDGKTLFRDMLEGKAFTNATAKNASAVFLLCPTALVFGVWDSTGPKGGLGAKFQRALTSEIVAVGAQEGAKVASRLDPCGINAKVDIFESKDNKDDWTIEETEAKQVKNKLVPFGKGKASSINHSNIPPSIDTFAGGVTFDYALQTVVLSLPALRKLRFVTDLNGEPLANPAAATDAARVALAALALSAIIHQRAQGYDLRSRCLLIPDGPLTLDVIRADGTTEAVAVSTAEAATLLNQAREAAAAAGLLWQREPLQLKAAPKFVSLIKRSRDLAAAGIGEGA